MRSPLDNEDGISSFLLFPVCFLKALTCKTAPIGLFQVRLQLFFQVHFRWNRTSPGYTFSREVQGHLGR
jgi:hypothetical protein